jgi:glycosyltransferase involved in cell wall biosynthesis
MKSFTFSVVLCTYQGEAFLKQQLESLLAQTRLPDEIVIGDDASTDSSWNILRDFATVAQARGVHVKLMRHPENVGFVANFSATLRQASGDILLLCDQDDIWCPAKLADMETRFLADPSITLMCSDARLVDADGRGLSHTLFEALGLNQREWYAVECGQAFRVLLCRSMVTGATAAFRRELIDMALPVAEGWIHDEWLAIVASAIGRVEVIRQPLIDYRQHEANQVGMWHRTWRDKYRDLVTSRNQQLRDEVHRMGELHERIGRLGGRVPECYLEHVTRRRQHVARRLAMGKLPRYCRLVSIYREARKGCYSEYATGLHTVLRDLMRRG